MTLVTHGPHTLDAERFENDLGEGIVVARHRFRNFEVVDRVFKKALAKADDDAAEQEIRGQWSESKAEFWQRRANAQSLQVAKRDALDKYPLAKEFADDIKGSSPAEIEASAKRFHERMEKVTKDADEKKVAAEKELEDAKQQAL